MIKKIEIKLLIKSLIVVFLLSGIVISLKISWNFLSRTSEINQALVESNKPSLNEELVRQASKILENKER